MALIEFTASSAIRVLVREHLLGQRTPPSRPLPARDQVEPIRPASRSRSRSAVLSCLASAGLLPARPSLILLKVLLPESSAGLGPRPALIAATRDLQRFGDQLLGAGEIRKLVEPRWFRELTFRATAAGEIVHALEGDVDAQVAFARPSARRTPRAVHAALLNRLSKLSTSISSDLLIDRQLLGGFAREVRQDAHDERNLDFLLQRHREFHDVVFNLHAGARFRAMNSDCSSPCARPPRFRLPIWTTTTCESCYL